jgi:hypothetical protein
MAVLEDPLAIATDKIDLVLAALLGTPRTSS